MGCCISQDISDNLRDEIIEAQRNNRSHNNLSNNKILIIEKDEINSPPNYNEVIKKSNYL